jgi:hypothetical protein
VTAPLIQALCRTAVEGSQTSLRTIDCKAEQTDAHLMMSSSLRTSNKQLQITGYVEFIMHTATIPQTSLPIPIVEMGRALQKCSIQRLPFAELFLRFFFSSIAQMSFREYREAIC